MRFETLAEAAVLEFQPLGLTRGFLKLVFQIGNARQHLIIAGDLPGFHVGDLGFDRIEAAREFAAGLSVHRRADKGQGNDRKKKSDHGSNIPVSGFIGPGYVIEGAKIRRPN
ncbi:MAG: hypothetical protein DHS20C06_18130 [Hyphobacterium sp.]|nr:MAG: hypothetical protein DHS20C06_18130 [Hyphobacterium sp.]